MLRYGGAADGMICRNVANAARTCAQRFQHLATRRIGYRRKDGSDVGFFGLGGFWVHFR